jgi:hypothetical protein
MANKSVTAASVLATSTVTPKRIKVAAGVTVTAGQVIAKDADKNAIIPPHSPSPIPVLTVSGAAGAKAISLQSVTLKQRGSGWMKQCSPRCSPSLAKRLEMNNQSVPTPATGPIRVGLRPQPAFENKGAVPATESPTWEKLQLVNRIRQAEYYEGLVAKREDAAYPYTRHADDNATHWTKRRWAF